MFRSMTGYGAGRAENDAGALRVEIRSVNGKQREIRCRLPNDLLALEAKMREQIQAHVCRGRVDLLLHLERDRNQPIRFGLSLETAKRAAAAWKTLAEEFGGDGEPTPEAILKVPGVWECLPAAEVDLESVKPLVSEALARALVDFDASRKREGDVLIADLRGRRDAIRRASEKIDSLSAAASSEAARLLRTQIERLLGEVPVDEARLAQEIAVAAQKSDVTEELVRLSAHLERLDALIEGEGGEIGRALDFLVQEIRREVNTIASKTARVEIDEQVLLIKGELEKIREQAANLE